MTYDELLMETDNIGVVVKEKPLMEHDGLCFNERIAINCNLKTSLQKLCVLAEELGHYYTSYGNILDLQSISNIKQENLARLWAYNKLIGLKGIIDAYEQGYSNPYEIAEFLDVTEEFLIEALEFYRRKFGTSISLGRYTISFEPNLQVFKDTSYGCSERILDYL